MSGRGGGKERHEANCPLSRETVFIRRLNLLLLLLLLQKNPPGPPPRPLELSPGVPAELPTADESLARGCVRLSGRRDRDPALRRRRRRPRGLCPRLCGRRHRPDLRGLAACLCCLPCLRFRCCPRNRGNRRRRRRGRDRGPVEGGGALLRLARARSPECRSPFVRRLLPHVPRSSPRRDGLDGPRDRHVVLLRALARSDRAGEVHRGVGEAPRGAQGLAGAGRGGGAVAEEEDDFFSVAVARSLGRDRRDPH